MADIEHVGERVTLVQAQDAGLGPPDHQCAQLVPQCPSRRPVVNRLSHAGAHVLQTLQSAVEVPADSGGRRPLERTLDPGTWHHRVLTLVPPAAYDAGPAPAAIRILLIVSHNDDALTVSVGNV